ncbi:hypothetical protein LTR48_007582, partial [Friedmanniomyces endolithicus]
MDEESHQLQEYEAQAAPVFPPPTVQQQRQYVSTWVQPHTSAPPPPTMPQPQPYHPPQISPLAKLENMAIPNLFACRIQQQQQQPYQHPPQLQACRHQQQPQLYQQPKPIQ